MCTWCWQTIWTSEFLDRRPSLAPGLQTGMMDVSLSFCSSHILALKIPPSLYFVTVEWPSLMCLLSACVPQETGPHCEEGYPTRDRLNQGDSGTAGLVLPATNKVKNTQLIDAEYPASNLCSSVGLWWRWRSSGTSQHQTHGWEHDVIWKSLEQCSFPGPQYELKSLLYSIDAPQHPCSLSLSYTHTRILTHTEREGRALGQA